MNKVYAVAAVNAVVLLGIAWALVATGLLNSPFGLIMMGVLLFAAAGSVWGVRGMARKSRETSPLRETAHQPRADGGPHKEAVADADPSPKSRFGRRLPRRRAEPAAEPEVDDGVVAARLQRLTARLAENPEPPVELPATAEGEQPPEELNEPTALGQVPTYSPTVSEPSAPAQSDDAEDFANLSDDVDFDDGAEEAEDEDALADGADEALHASLSPFIATSRHRREPLRFEADDEQTDDVGEEEDEDEAAAFGLHADTHSELSEADEYYDEHQSDGGGSHTSAIVVADLVSVVSALDRAGLGDAEDLAAWSALLQDMDPSAPVSPEDAVAFRDWLHAQVPASVADTMFHIRAA
mgnify:CR=1 FL=1